MDYICFIDVQKLQADYQDRSKSVGVMTKFVLKNIILTLVHFLLVLYCELFIHARTRIQLRWFQNIC